MAELFQVRVPTVNEYLKTLYTEGEIQPEATIRKFLVVRQEGRRQVSRNIDHHNLDAILAVGYRVRSTRGTQFRRWATERLREYLVKGFVLDDERLKNPPVGGSAVPGRFDELLDRIRDIRASERRMYLRVREIFAMAADYAPSLPRPGYRAPAVSAQASPDQRPGRTIQRPHQRGCLPNPFPQRRRA
jgi:hypothetical protein